MTYLNKIYSNIYLLCAIGIIFSFGTANAQSEKVIINPITITVDE